MLKFLGAVLVILACGAMGTLAAMGLHARCKELRAFRYGISALQTEISYGLNPLPSALLRASEEAGGNVGAMLAETSAALACSTGENASSLWQSSVSSNIENLPLAQ